MLISMFLAGFANPASRYLSLSAPRCGDHVNMKVKDGVAVVTIDSPGEKVRQETKCRSCIEFVG